MYDIYATIIFGFAFASANYDEFGGGDLGAIGAFILPFLQYLYLSGLEKKSEV